MWAFGEKLYKPRAAGCETYAKRGEDKIIPPANAVELERIKELIYRSPDIREDVVANLRTQVLGGVYKVEAEQVAEKIIQHGIYILGAGTK